MPALPCPQATHDSLSRWAIGAYSISDIAQQKANEAALAIKEFFVAAFDRIEPVTVAGKQLFRAQIMGLTEAETRKACEIMERAPHQCLIVAPEYAGLESLGQPG
jgi:hypothetical protein